MSPSPLLLAAFLPAAHADVILPPREPPALAQRVQQAAGDPYAEAFLAFTFVVTTDGQEQVRRTHRWCPKAGIVEVETAEGKTRISAVDGSPLEGASLEAADKAWGRFVNDSYWLLAPSKVLDPGVRAEAVGPDRLDLRFDGVGLTPGDRYSLTVDADGHVSAWSFVLQSGRTGSFRWEEGRPLGGLYLSALRVSEDGSTSIRFQDLQVGPACPL